MGKVEEREKSKKRERRFLRFLTLKFSVIFAINKFPMLCSNEMPAIYGA